MVKRSVGTDHVGTIAKNVRDLAGPEALMHELIQNAEDASGATMIRFVVKDEHLEVFNDGQFRDCGYQDLEPDDCLWRQERGHRCDLHSFRLIGSADKSLRKGTVGAFGIGFTAVYQVTDNPELITDAVHWVRDETLRQDERIDECAGCEACTDATDTTFLLPWAVDKKSPFREKSKLAVVESGFIDELEARLLDLAPVALLFLKNLSAIEVVTRSGGSVRVEADRSDELVTIQGPNGISRWLTLEDVSEDLEAMQRQGDPWESRLAIVQVAFPLETNLQDSRLYAFLPTQEYNSLGFHINADFVPLSTRAHIATEGKPGAWNRAAIRCAGGLVSSHLEELYERLGPDTVWSTLANLSSYRSKGSPSPVEAWLSDLWGEVSREARSARILPTVAGDLVSPDSAFYLLAEKEDANATALEDGGFAIAVPGMRSYLLGINRKEALGIDDLTIDWLTAHGNLSAVADKDLEKVWSEVQVLVDRAPALDDQSREKLRNLDIGLSASGVRCRLRDGWNCDEEGVRLFGTLATEAVFIDVALISAHSSAVVDLVPRFDAESAIDLIVSSTPAELAEWINTERCRQLLEWLTHYQDELDDRLTDAIAGQPIFPTGDEFRCLDDLSLPGDFRDPLGLADLVAPWAVDDFGRLLRRIGVSELDFATYVRDHLPSKTHLAVDEPSVWREVVKVVARHIGSLRETSFDMGLLGRLPIAETADGFVTPGEAYFRSPELVAILGDSVQYVGDVSVPVRALLDDAGVADRAHAADLLRRIDGCTAEPPSDRSVALIGSIVRYIAEHEGTFDDSFYQSLVDRRWMPVKQDPEWCRPDETASVTDEILFASQAAFLAFDRGTQYSSRSLLEIRLAVQYLAQPGQIIRHLLVLASEDSEIPPGLFNRLDQVADETDFLPLEGKRCIPTPSGRLVRARDLYQESHPFGRFRFSLGPEIARFANLWRALAIRAVPLSVDAVGVLIDVAADLGSWNRQISSDDAVVVQRCWAMLDDVEGLDLDLEGMLGEERCALNGRGVLVAPRRLFFRDSPSLADALGSQLGDALVVPPDKGARAMSAAGVRSLREEARPEIEEAGKRESADEVTSRLRGRRHQLARVFAQLDAVENLYQFLDTCEAFVVDNLFVAYSIDLGSGQQQIWSDQIEPRAIFREDDGCLLIRRDQKVDWGAVARAVISAVMPSAHLPYVLPAVRSVLSATTSAAADDQLDQDEVPELAAIHLGDLEGASLSGWLDTSPHGATQQASELLASVEPGADDLGVLSIQVVDCGMS